MILRLVVGLAITAIGLAIAGRRVLWLYRLISSGQPATGRLKDVRARLETELAEVLLDPRRRGSPPAAAAPRALSLPCGDT